MTQGFIKWALLALLTLIWGSSFILIKIGLTGYGFVEAASIRMMAAGATLLPFGLMNAKHVPKDRWKFIILSGAIGMFIPSFLFTLAQSHITSATAGILNGLTPVFTFLFSLFLFNVPFKPLQAAGLILGLLSSIFLVVTRSAVAFEFNIYALLVILATVCYGLNVNISKERLHMLKPVVVATTTVSVAGLLAFCFVFIPRLSHYHIDTSHLTPLVALIGLGMVGTAVAQFLFLQLLSKTSSLFASAVTYTMPIVAIFWGVMDGEAFTIAHVLGIVGILAGVVLIRKGG
jgi:drug/metabolite transporter (DMT)-like permease